MSNYHLSDRMAAVAGLVPAGVTACDIGCDHGFVAIHLVEAGVCPGMIALDINKGPLLRAKEHIESAGLSTYIDTRLSDGLEAFEAGEAECMIAAGMGGRLIVKILSDYPEKVKSLRYLVLQPQSELSFVRGCLRRQGFVIRKEDMILEDGKFYPMMLVETETCGEGSGKNPERNGQTSRKKATGAEHESSRCDPGEDPGAASDRRAAYRESLEDEFGPCLIRDNHPVLLQYLDWWEGQQNKILREVLAYPERRRQVEEEIDRIRDVRGIMKEKVVQENGGYV